MFLDREVIMFWDRVASVYDLFENAYNKSVYTETGRICAEYIGENDTVLECACGTGLLSAVIAPKCRRLTATDFSEKMLKKAKKNWLQRNKVTIIIVAVLIAGLGIMFYPSFSNYWNSFHQTRAISSYIENVSSMDSELYEQQISAAREYNRKLAQSGISWTLTDEERALYEEQLDITGTGIMGYIQIDKINVMLPVYHGISESVLQVSIGHLEGTSLPVGCESYNKKTGELDDPTEGNHIVLSGHRGLPSAQLFSDLDKLVEGDTFTLNVLDETYCYQVDQIRIVLPEDLSNLALEQGKDYCTLVTCTPYGVNTHRLLVRGKRIANREELEIVEDARQLNSLYVAGVFGVFMVVILFLFVMFSRRRKH